MNETIFSKGYNQFLVSLVLVGVVTALGAYTYVTLKNVDYFYTGPATVSVTGVGEVIAVPDVGSFSFSVSESGTDASLALEASATKINNVIAALKEAGVAEKDIKTESYNLYPKYKYESQPCPRGSYCPQEQVEDGFEVSQTIVVKVRDLDKAGELISLVGTKEVANISSLSFTVDDDEVLKAEARALAIANAKAKANVLAKDLGVTLGDMISYYEEDYGYQPYPYGMGGDMKEMSAMASFDAPELPRGENTTTSRVNLTYQLK
ncbi:MAG TPA: SIMPL domain-containing protein [Candidatus Paceibacterota bacterium]|nr:SIMPL domain-containing protein [Candidatus Paceibacterota bacterium]HMO82848.1 SIMPL domain-containing protein [Candidatus Paceibacterota bacterium]